MNKSVCIFCIVVLLCICVIVYTLSLNVGKENVMVVDSNDLQVRNMTRVQATMDKVFDFFGLCPFVLPPVMKKTLSGRNSVCVCDYSHTRVHTQLLIYIHL